MPTYEYACTTCSHRLEAVQSFTDDPLTECPECGGPLRKVYGAVGIVLKGSGFYKTDSRAATGSNGGGKKGADTSTSDTSGDASTKKEPTSDKGGSRRAARTRAARTRAARTRAARTKAARTRPPRRRPARPAEGSVAAERHVGDGEGLTGCHAGEPAQVAPDLDDGLQHPLEGGGDGHLPDGLGQRAPSILSPSAPTEKSPLTVLTPEWMPETDCT